MISDSDREQADDRYPECDPELPALQEAEDGDHRRPPAEFCQYSPDVHDVVRSNI